MQFTASSNNDLEYIIILGSCKYETNMQIKTNECYAGKKQFSMLQQQSVGNVWTLDNRNTQSADDNKLILFHLIKYNPKRHQKTKNKVP